ncbi:unnamed protein product [Schistosoma margrebowiei]|uniref:Uncharacterized protein n=1 Tax=Schistosoma margrebowiei TaxID=48269 RepID=A0A3P7XV36_9TREM|nr:unnamed protein product [Schistosoma margrebowiei]
MFTKMRGRKSNVRRFNRIPNQWCTWAPVSRAYSLCQRSSTHCLLAPRVLFTELRGRKANVWRCHRVGGHEEST